MNAFVQFLVILSMIFFDYCRNLLLESLKSPAGKQDRSGKRRARKRWTKLLRLRSISLSEPLAEKTRPANFRELVGQEDGLRALRAALFGPNPQHVIIYGPPGVGKTAAARVVLEEAKHSKGTPFCRMQPLLR